MQSLDDEVIDAITVSVPMNVSSGKNKDWTFAIWEEFDKVAKKRGLTLHPIAKPYKGEYLTDFHLFDPDTGPLLACESQLWSPLGDADQNRDIAWAFDKLRGVKAPTKMLIFEQDFEPNGAFPKLLRDKLIEYLINFVHHSTKERYIFIQFSQSAVRAYEWKPLRDGQHQPSEIIPTRIKLTGAD